MTSLARRHRERIAAEQLAEHQGAVAKAGQAPEIDESSPEAREYASLKAKLYANLRTLQDIQSHEDRQPKKREFAAEFAPWIQGVILAGVEGKATQDDIVALNLVWAIDYEDYDYAIVLATHVIRHGLVLPEPYKRKPACLIAEEIAEAALKPESTVTHKQLLATLVITLKSDMPDPVKAKLAKAIGRSFAAQAEAFDPQADNAVAGGKQALLTSAVDYLKRALLLDSKAGVKKELETLERKLADAGGRSIEQSTVLTVESIAQEQTPAEGSAEETPPASAD